LFPQAKRKLTSIS